MAIDIKVPQLPESVADATIATWHVKPGDKVSRDQNLVDIETDKVVLEVVAEADGVLGEITAEEGTTVTADEVIGKIEEGDGAASSDSKKEEKSDDSDKKADKKDDKKDSGSSEKKGSGEKMNVTVPQLPESVSDATISAWHVKEGDEVKRDQNLVDIETDKVVLEVVAPADGVLVKIEHDEGATVGADDVIGIVEAGASSGGSASKSDDSKSESAAESKDDGGDSEVAGPAVRRLLGEHGLKPSDVKGTGKGGRVTKEDVEKHVKAGSSSKSSDSSKQQSAQPAVSGDRDQKRVPMTRLRKRIAERLLQAKNDTAMLTTFNEINMKPIMDLRKKYKDVFEETHGTRLGFMGFYIKAVTEALKRFPDVNASIDGDDIVYHNYFDVSIAVSTPRGLVTPVLRDTDKMSIADMEKGIRELAIKGRDGKLTLDEMQGGNFTVTNGGVFGSLLSTPILNPPQSAILGMHKIQERPMVVDGKIEILPMMYLALSYDHRIIDGKESVGFLVTVKELLEDPQRLILDI
ncbi:2-oxoglutarate dehydrogenase [Idiomarina sp. WRN-38]|uniref:2-oxoglutarate dehydrogenase complex dihydrolipoyllysine-residue succinyltransferase n=1 Tax=unclassified Idiomarina TaxID=2614829 RepID=UPI0007339B44|nr:MULTISPECIES: 2-oxoglutarate dehydrogenase complex dihydrolipoyllysine-residue succinyltransferase [unclassified Idiomarina]KTG23479.1 2-oxoglutarate dehydrogenase [Idiomarina sp. H105]MBF37574.1 dihydrolipoyllysine-residue succinyltransferase [Idiomarinaceae bacterium]MCH2454573.1 2-oxoglutarate dehydrogenase complex dihydrolipoyllysine-residue succinyltransferase [Idiomarina sp.]OAE90871.1 2-oxoglutarate dehydrogenase [Idiomarina sp. WRN-38]WPZ00401.1 2-oxoglutarate dehydrogenase complex |tara:strand:+ start:13344 stop:14906 length:1563 start_codon:yes stop_codon:yes gene_type:complete